VDWVRRFRASWPNKNIAARKKLERILSLCARKRLDPNEPSQPFEAAEDY